MKKGVTMYRKIKKFLNHERMQIIAAIICLVIVASGICCESQTRSLLDPTKKVTRAELVLEVNHFMDRADLRFKELDREDTWKAVIFDQVMLWSTTGVFNPAALVPLLVGVLGVGAVADNVRKRRDIKKLNNA